MLYDSADPSQTLSGPLIEPGGAGMLETNVLTELAVLVPQKLVAVTEIGPSDEPTVALIEVVVEVPLHPEGRFHV